MSLMYSVIKQNFSGKYEEPLASQTEYIESNDAWVLPPILVLATFLQLRVDTVWSESRIFRKLVNELKSRGKNQIRREVISTFPSHECTNDQVLAKLYVLMSKGRHRAANRLYSYLLFWTFWIIDILLSLGQVHIITVMDSDALIVLRLMLSLGSLQVIGSVNSRRNIVVVSIVTIAAIYGGTFFLHDISTPHNNEHPWSLDTPLIVYKIVVYIRIIMVGGGILISIYSCIKDCRGTGNHISNIVYRIEEIGEGKPVLESHNLRFLKTRKKIQENYTKNFEMSSNLIVATSFYFSPSLKTYVEVVVSCALFISNPFLLSGWCDGRLPKIAIVEAFEFIGMWLLLVNDTMIEPALFATLIDIADTEDDEA